MVAFNTSLVEVNVVLLLAEVFDAVVLLLADVEVFEEDVLVLLEDTSSSSSKLVVGAISVSVAAITGGAMIASTMVLRTKGRRRFRW